MPNPTSEMPPDLLALVPTTAKLLTLTEIELASGWADPKADKPTRDAARSALNRLLALPEIKDWLQGEGKPICYPESAIAKFENLLALKKKGLTPKATLVAIRELTNPDAGSLTISGGGDVEEPETALVPMAQRLAQMTMPEAQAEGRAMVQDFARILVSELKAANVVQVQEDRFLTREQAAEMLACSPNAVGRRVRPVMASTWSFLDIQAFMREAREKAHARPQKQRKQER